MSGVSIIRSSCAVATKSGQNNSSLIALQRNQHPKLVEFFKLTILEKKPTSQWNSIIDPRNCFASDLLEHKQFVVFDEGIVFCKTEQIKDLVMLLLIDPSKHFKITNF